MNKTNILGDLEESTFTKNDIKKIVDQSLKIFDIYDGIVEIIYVNNLEIQKLNNQHRGIDKSTDVLSFPQIKISNKKNRLLGSLVISMTMVREKEEEEEDVIKHGLLHLLDYDHESNQKEWDLAANKIKCKL